MGDGERPRKSLNESLKGKREYLKARIFKTGSVFTVSFVFAPAQQRSLTEKHDVLIE